jgi:curved DNA-binding protein CbpA
MDCFNISTVLNDYYALLEVERDATTDTIRKNYRKIVKKHHPDRGGNEEMYLLLSEAYECLTDPIKRQNYDIELNDSKNNQHVPSFFKDEYEFFIKANTVPKTEEEIKKIHDEQFKTIKDTPMNEENLIQRMGDAKAERDIDDVELENVNIKNLLEQNKDLTVNDIFEYIKQQNNQIIEKKDNDLIYNTLINNNYHTSISDAFTNPLSSNIQNDSQYKSVKYMGEFELKGDLNVNEIMNLKLNKPEQTKVTMSDIEKRIKEREDQDRLYGIH